MNEHTCLSKGDQGIVREHNLAFGIYRVDFGSSGTFHLFDFDITDRPVPA